jgi:aspartyl-tRNA(Asn)/glutamyl-tRNA(Gln) amidotransferase subunit B
MKVRVLVGMEVHLQLRTASKMFCRCPVRFGAPPNTLVCPVCLGQPGALPVPNRDAMLMALALGAALGCEAPDVTRFDRKNYFYPDLPKGYQISQYEQPLGRGGTLEIETGDGRKPIRLRRLHLEEDTGKSLHAADAPVSRVDLNRAGTPLVEIVSEPDLASPREARIYLNTLRTLVRYLDVSDGNMQEGNLRCEPNVNLHIAEDGRLVKTPIVEIKNLNSVRNVERALAHEVDRQLAEYRAHGPAVADRPRATRGFDESSGATFVMREKEELHDYRFFPDPDLPPIVIGAAWRTEAAARVPELPDVRRARFRADYELSAADARLLCREPRTADYFERVVAAGAAPQPAVHWMRELAGHANARRLALADAGVPAERLAALVRLVTEGRVPRRAAQEQVLPRMLDTAEEAEQIVAELGLEPLEDVALLEQAARHAIDANPRAAADVRGGKAKALGALMGLVMRETRGKANPHDAQRVLKRILETE